MTDALLLGIAFVFFAIAVAYVLGCERLIDTDDDRRLPDGR